MTNIGFVVSAAASALNKDTFASSRSSFLIMLLYYQFHSILKAITVRRFESELDGAHGASPSIRITEALDLKKMMSNFKSLANSFRP